MLKNFWFFLLNFNLFLNKALANGTTGGIQLPNPVQYGTIEEVLQAISKWLAEIAIPIVAIMMLVGAYQILFSAGDPEKVNTGRRTILYTVIAYGIILIGWGITSIIKNLLGSR